MSIAPPSPSVRVTPRQQRLWKLTDLRQRIETEIASIEAEIEAERRAAIRALGIDYRKVQARCGTESGYTRHRRHDEPACEECKRARREGERARAAKRRERQEEAA